MFYVRKFIQPFLSDAAGALENRNTNSKVSKGRLAKLWSSDKKRAIRIIKNGGVDEKPLHFVSDKRKTEEYFDKKFTGAKSNLKDKILSFENANKAEIPWLTPEEVKKLLFDSPDDSSPGKDGVTYKDLKEHWNENYNEYTDLLNVIIYYRKLPRGWKHELVRRIPKKKFDPDDLSTFRDISLLPCLYKVFVKCLVARIRSPVANNYIGYWQRGFLQKRDRQELIFCVKTAVDDFKHISSRFYTLFIDFRDAFGSVKHEYLIKSLLEAGIEEGYCEIFADIYEDSHIEVICGNELTKEFARTIGCKTGDPASPVLFIVGLDKHLRRAVNKAEIITKAENPKRISPLPAGGYADDVAFSTRKEDAMTGMVTELKESIKEENSGLIVRPDKCSMFYERRSGNRWYSAKMDSLPRITFNGEEVEVLKRHEKFEYLGKPLTVAGEYEGHVKEIFYTYEENLQYISSSVAPLVIKIQALEMIAMLSIYHHFYNTRITELELQGFVAVLVKHLRIIFGLNHSTTVRSCFQSKQNGGLGIRKPSIVYRATRISHLLAMLNHEEENFRFVARNSLQLDMNKRGVSRTANENSFLGFKKKENGTLDTHIKGGFGASSDWSTLNLLSHKIGIALRWEFDSSQDIMDCGKALAFDIRSGECINLSTTKLFRKKIVSLQLQEELKHQKDLKMQGTLIGLEFIDYLVSQDIFKNIQWSDQLVQFWYKMRHNVLPCNYTLNIWYKTPPECILDNHRLESMAHILTSCVEFKDFDSVRHDTIVNKIGSELSAEKVFVNKSVKTALGDLQIEDSILSQKPDIILKDNKNIMILEVSCPYDLYADEAYQAKYEKYTPLLKSLKHSGYKCALYPIIIGSIGLVHKRCLSHLIKVGLPKCQAKGLLKWCSNSNILFARKIWKLRCWIVKEK